MYMKKKDYVVDLATIAMVSYFFMSEVNEGEILRKRDAQFKEVDDNDLFYFELDDTISWSAVKKSGKRVRITEKYSKRIYLIELMNGYPRLYEQSSTANPFIFDFQGEYLKVDDYHNNVIKLELRKPFILMDLNNKPSGRYEFQNR